MLKFWPFCLFSDMTPLACGNLIHLVPNLHNLWRYLLYQLSFNTSLDISNINPICFEKLTLCKSLLSLVYFFLKPVYASVWSVYHLLVFVCHFCCLCQHLLPYFKKVIYSQLYTSYQPYCKPINYSQLYLPPNNF